MSGRSSPPLPSPDEPVRHLILWSGPADRTACGEPRVSEGSYTMNLDHFNCRKCRENSREFSSDLEG